MNPTKQSLLYPEIAQKVLGGRHTKQYGHFIWMTSNRFQSWSEVIKLMVYDTGILRNWSMVQSWAISPIVLTKYTNSPNKLRATPRRYPNSAKMNLSQASSVVVQRVVFFGVAWCMGTRILSLLPPYPMLRPRKHDS